MSTNVLDSNRVTWMLSGQLAEDLPVSNVRVDKSPFVVGRRTDSALCIPSPTISGKHAEIAINNGALCLQDLSSTNGTFINGVRVQEVCVINHGDLIQFAQTVFRASLQSTESACMTVQEDSCDRALALIQFDQLMTERAVLPHFQPLVDIHSLETFGYEVLGRSRLFGLKGPGAMFAAAKVLDMEGELSRIFREEGIQQGRILPDEHMLFVNTHPAEMEDLDLLIFSLRELREQEPTRPLVLEIHESSVARRGQMTELLAALTDLNIQLAYDDFGAGQARLVELVEVPCDYLKFDMKLVQNIGSASKEHQKMLASLVQMALELGITPLAEGIEKQTDHEVCRDMGFVCAQGFLYGRPALPKSLLQHPIAQDSFAASVLENTLG